jgi:hypothetical protein
MVRATIILGADDPAEREAFESWRRDWREELSLLSDDEGCRCCVSIFRVEAPEEAIAAIPEPIRGGSEWDDPTRPKDPEREAVAECRRLAAEAGKAFRAGDYGRVIKLLSPREDRLCRVEASKLGYARKHHSLWRTFRRWLSGGGHGG